MSPLRMARGRNPFEFFMLGWSVAVGFGSLLSPGPPPTLINALPRWIIVGWALVLVGCGTGAIIGVVLRAPALGLLIERSALIPLAAAAFGYALALWSVNGSRAFSVSLLISAYGLAAAARAIQISWDVRRASKLRGEAAP